MSSTAVGQRISANGETHYTLTNQHGMRVVLSDRGASMREWHAPDRDGQFADVLLGYANPEAYLNNACYFGVTVGRWANRIAGAAFTLDGIRYALDRNEGDNQLHGGANGFHQALWQSQVQHNGVLFTLDSPAGEGGFPGTVHAQVDYQLGDDGSLVIVYEAVTDAPTPMNMTAHPYFNLNGGAASIGHHVVQIEADQYLTVDAQLIPVGVADVAGGVFDFRQPVVVGPHLLQSDSQTALAGGIDHCFCLRAASGLRVVARAVDPQSGRQLSVASTQRGLQFYTGNYLAGVQGKDGQQYEKYAGFCMESQAFPNQINSPDAEAVVLRPGQVYRQTTIYRCS